MKKVELGKTGIMVSKMCFGSLTLGPLQKGLSLDEGSSVLAHAINRGVNFTDTAELYETYPYIREAMRKTGKYDLVVSSKTYAYSRELAVKAVEDARKQLDRDYVDLFMLHEQESIHTLRGHGEALEYLYECKQKGIIRAVGASMHHVAAVEGGIARGLEVMHPILNRKGLGIVDGSREEMEEMVKKAHDLGVGIFSMKPLGGGNLHKEAEACLSYVLSLPFVDSVAIGMQSVEEVDANFHFWEKGYFTPEAKKELEGTNRKLHIDDWCEGCGACVARCKQQALSLVENQCVCNSDKCVLCGYCSAVCPVFAIKVV